MRQCFLPTILVSDLPGLELCSESPPGHAAESSGNTESALQPENRRRCPAEPHRDCSRRTQTPVTETHCQDSPGESGLVSRGSQGLRSTADSRRSLGRVIQGRPTGMGAPHPHHNLQGPPPPDLGLSLVGTHQRTPGWVLRFPQLSRGSHSAAVFRINPVPQRGS